MKALRFLGLAAVAALITSTFWACDDETSQIGSSLTQDDVTIVADSSFVIEGQSVHTPIFDSRSVTNLLGHINVPGYGELHCSFVAQLMAASSLDIPDSIGIERIDSMKLFLRAARGSATGDTLAPQKINVYRLTKRLPSDIDNKFNPEGYYSAESLLGSRSYTLTALGMNDSIYTNSQYIDIQVPMPLELARTFFTDYRTRPEIFQWPSTFADYFPGIYVEPSFGRGCITNVAQTQMITYYHHYETRTVIEDSVAVKRQVTVKDSVIFLGTAPESLNSNNVSLKIAQSMEDAVSAGRAMIVAPGGYNVRIKFPIRDVIKKYFTDTYNLAVVNNLTFGIGATSIKNDYGVAMPPYLLMVRTSELEEFFAQNKLPDSKTSFYGAYSSTDGRYNFTSMRDYLIEIIDRVKSGGEINSDDEDFTLVPVYLNLQSSSSSSTVVTTIMECTPYIYRPTMCELHFDRTFVSFTYSKQQIN